MKGFGEIAFPTEIQLRKGSNSTLTSTALERERPMTSTHILLLHSVHHPITVEEVAHLFEGSDQLIPVRIVPASLALSAATFDWRRLVREQELIVARDVESTIKDHPNADLSYFGFAPIPLAIHLGTLFHARRVRIYQKNHRTGAWSWPEKANRKELQVTKLDGPDSSMDTVLRIPLRAKVDARFLDSLVPAAAQQIEFGLGEVGEDTITHPEEIKDLARAFLDLLDSRTGRDSRHIIHIFGAIPTGVAFALGQQRSPTQHPKLQTYQYVATETPSHQPAITIGSDEPSRHALSREQVDIANGLRNEWRQQLLSLKAFHRAQQSKTDASWLVALGLEGNTNWDHLPPFAQLKEQCYEIDAQDDREFRLRADAQRWSMADQLLFAIKQMDQDAPEKGLRALRLFFFHETLHENVHELTTATARLVRRFVQILELIDYEADVWAILHEFAIWKHKKFDPDTEVEELRRIISCSLDTMCAFDASAAPFVQLEVRRFNRYLIWVWQLARLHSLTSVPDALAVLLAKPAIEISGPRIVANGDRYYYELRKPWVGKPEIGILTSTRALRRRGSTNAFDIESLIDAIANLDLQTASAQLRAVHDEDRGNW